MFWKACYASISLKTHTVEGDDKSTVIEPFNVTHINLKHKDGCMPKNDEAFRDKSFFKTVKENVKSNKMISTQQLYEKARAALAEQTGASNYMAMPDYQNFKGNSKSNRTPRGRRNFLN